MFLFFTLIFDTSVGFFNNGVTKEKAVDDNINKLLCLENGKSNRPASGTKHLGILLNMFSDTNYQPAIFWATANENAREHHSSQTSSKLFWNDLSRTKSGCHQHSASHLYVNCYILALLLFLATCLTTSVCSCREFCSFFTVINYVCEWFCKLLSYFRNIIKKRICGTSIESSWWLQFS